MLTAVTMLIYRLKGSKAAVKALGVVAFIIVGAALLYQAVLFKSKFLSGMNRILLYLVLAAVAVWGVFKTIRNKQQGFGIGAKKFLDAIPSLLMLVIVIGGIVAGFFTATEASAIAVLYSLILAFIYREVSVSDLPAIILRSVKTTGIVMLLVATSIGLSWIMAYENIPQNVSEGLLSLSDNPIIILLMINLILLFVGVFYGYDPCCFNFYSHFLPIVTAMGVDPIHFGIIMVLNLSVGLCAHHR
jgi:tripartite ATP-independent transporter DctM subunit